MRIVDIMENTMGEASRGKMEKGGQKKRIFLDHELKKVLGQDGGMVEMHNTYTFRGINECKN